MNQSILLCFYAKDKQIDNNNNHQTGLKEEQASFWIAY